MATAPTLKLNDGNEIPQIGLGTWPMQDQQVAEVIAQATEIGYRHFDTAVNYKNETGVGDGVRKSGIAREEVFIATKVPGRHHGYDKTLASLEESLQRLQTDYVDLYLIHWPNPSQELYVDTWRAFVELQKAGKVKSIGVSNFKPAHIDRIVSETGVTPGQAVLRWHVQQGLVALPKTSSTERLQQNIDVFSFELTAYEMRQISAIDDGQARVADSDEHEEY